MSDIRSLGTKVLKIHWGKDRKIQQESFVSKKKGMTREDIRKKAQAMSNTLKKKGWDGILQVSIVYPNLEVPRNGMWVQAGHNISLMNSYDGDKEPEQFFEFRILYSRNPPRAGKSDNANGDCFHDCLKQIMGDQLVWQYGGSMKKFLKIDRKAGVDITHIPKVEARLKSWKINVEGDYIYKSTVNCTQEINLLLIDGHYTIKPCNKLKLRVSYNEKIPMLWLKQGDLYQMFGTSLEYLSKEELWKLAKEFKSPYILIPVDRLVKTDRTKDPYFCIETLSKEFCKNAEILKDKSGGKLNLFKTGTFTSTALNHFDRSSKYKAPEPILIDETHWLQMSTSGGLIRSEKYKGPLHMYDFTSFYPSIMSNKLQLFPVKRGKEETITKAEFDVPKLKYGMYRCNITDVNKKVFVYNEDNFYTHFDIHSARSFLKGKATLIEDGQPNAWTYERSDLLTGFQLFKPFVDDLFRLKSDKVPYAKEILNCLWVPYVNPKSLKKIYQNPKSTKSQKTIQLNGFKNSEMVH